MGKIADEIFQQSFKKRIPINVIFEVTRRCNLRCSHCYIPEKDRKEELKTNEILKTVDNLSATGSLFITFTGGEPFLRDDFFEILKYARRRNFDIRIFTNGTLIDEKKAEKLRKLKPSRVAVSLYGADEDTHEFFTGERGSFRKSIKALELLFRVNLSTAIKFLAMRKNIIQLNQMKKLAESLGAKLKVDPFVLPKDDGDVSPLEFALSVDKIRASFFKNAFLLQNECGGICSAGKNFAAIFYNGDVSPCLLIDESWGNIKKESFSEIWEKIGKSFRKKSFFEDVCGNCEKKNNCLFCPALGRIYKRATGKCLFLKL